MNGPLIPRPAVTLIALALTAGLLFVVLGPQNENSGRNAVVLASLVSGILGFSSMAVEARAIEMRLRLFAVLLGALFVAMLASSWPVQVASVVAFTAGWTTRWLYDHHRKGDV